MFYYEKKVYVGDTIEVEVYPSIRERNKKGIGRSVRQSSTKEAQSKANKVRAERELRRLIKNNFNANEDMYLTLKFFEDKTEEEAIRAINNFLRRLNYYRKKHGLEPLKYVGCIECGKRGKRWHAHFVVNKIDFEVVSSLWNEGRIWSETLYEHGDFAELAQYLLKDTGGTKRLRRSRNLVKPKEKVTELGKRRVRQFERDIVPKAPKGYYFVKQEKHVNDITGVAVTYFFAPIIAAALSRASARGTPKKK